MRIFRPRSQIVSSLAVFATLVLLSHVAMAAPDWSKVNRGGFKEDAVPVTIEFPSWFKRSFLDIRDDLADAKRAGKQGVLLFLSTPHCSYCKAFLDFTFADPVIQRELRRNFDVIGVEVISDSILTDVSGKSWTMKEYAAAQKAYVTPTLIFLRHDGKQMLRIVGYYPPEKFRVAMDYLLKGHYEREPFSAYLAKVNTSGKPAELIRDAELFGAATLISDRRAGTAKRPLMVLLERPNCDTCSAFHQKVLNHPPIRALIKKYDAVQLDMTDAKTAIITPTGERLTPKQWAEKLEISYAPALLFFDERGKEVYRLDSELLRERTEGSLQLVLEKGYLQEPQLQRWRNLKGRYRAP